jgi:hypothetical protein
MGRKELIEEKVSKFLMDRGFTMATWTNKLTCDGESGNDKEWKELEAYLLCSCGIFTEDRPLKILA